MGGNPDVERDDLIKFLAELSVRLLSLAVDEEGAPVAGIGEIEGLVNRAFATSTRFGSAYVGPPWNDHPWKIPFTCENWEDARDLWYEAFNPNPLLSAKDPRD